MTNMQPDPSASNAANPAGAPPATANTGALGAIGEVFAESGAERPIPASRSSRGRCGTGRRSPSTRSSSRSSSRRSTSCPTRSSRRTSRPSPRATPPCEAATRRTCPRGYGLGRPSRGLLILLLAPVLGQRADAGGRKKRWLLVFTARSSPAVRPLLRRADPAYFWYGAITLALGAVVFGDRRRSTTTRCSCSLDPKTIGKVSGLGWGLGYIGGIVALVIVVVLTHVDWFGIDTSDGLAYRLIAVGCAVWTIIFSHPDLPQRARGTPRGRPARKVGFFRSLRLLVQDVVALYHDPPAHVLVPARERGVPRRARRRLRVRRHPRSGRLRLLGERGLDLRHRREPRRRRLDDPRRPRSTTGSARKLGDHLRARAGS